MSTTPRPTRPATEPLRYATGGWPHGEVRELAEAEGGELVPSRSSSYDCSSAN